MRNNSKMKGVLFLIVSIVLLLVGCGPQENAEQLMAVNYSLENSNNSIRQEIASVYYELAGKRMDSYMAEQAEVWLPRSNWIRQNADSISVLIENLKKQVIKQSDSLRNDKVEVVKQLNDVAGVGYQLLNKIASFKDSIAERIQVNEDEISLIPGYRSSFSEEQRVKYKMQWLNKSFGSYSSSMAMVMLSKMENDVLITTKRLVKYCNMNVGYGCILRYEQFESLALSSSSYIKKGQTIKVRAGVGAFTNAAKPKIFIDGKEMKVIGPTVSYEFKPAGSPGKYIIPIKFEYNRPDGSLESKTEELEYVIADEK